MWLEIATDYHQNMYIYIYIYIKSEFFLQKFLHICKCNQYKFLVNSSVSPSSPLLYLLSSSVRKFLPYKIKTQWNYEEDNILLRRVIRYGWKHWGIISQDYSYINQSSIISLTSKEQQQFWKNLIKTNNLKQTLQTLQLRTNSSSLLKQYYINMQKFSREQQQLLPVNYNSVLQISKKINENNNGVTRKPWTKDETERLIYLLSNYASQDNQLLFSYNSHHKRKSIMYNWKLISSTYFPNRTLNDVKDKWHNIQSRIPWTKQEDQIIIDGVKQFGEKDQWDKIALTINSSATNSTISSSLLTSVVRSPSQCMVSIKRSTFKRPAKWNLQEDELLLKIIKEYYHKSSQVPPLSKNDDVWKRIAQNIPGRTAIQCRNRYIDTLDPSLKKGRYTAEDHFQLFMSIKKYGHRWSLVAKEMGRSKVAIAKIYSMWKYRNKFSYSKKRIVKGGTNSIYGKLLSHM
ncbi:myb-like protein L isoform X2 [Rhizophagus clarus]|uniref:Myb-like protein L isoform X2 n=1 Tax=Rhizophagus clarus TaxID=94130 RepID=A0A8H3QE70_9GLOM|nr:myb-like protein L isoform X2 [Rhizophagus clarus]